MMQISGLVVALTIVAWSLLPPAASYPWPEMLSEWHLFESPLAGLDPVPGVMYYEVNAPLYSDYAQKSRFIRLPEGGKASFHPSEVYDMPDGTVLIKNFFYFKDERKPAEGRHLLETRLLVRDQGLWYAMTYRWNQSQTDARRAIAGGSTDVSWVDNMGKHKQLHYLIPDVNQCKNCHNSNNVFVPLGIVTRQLNNEGTPNQLQQWQDQDLLITQTTLSPFEMERLVDYSNTGYSLEARARAYLDVNCGHCHSAAGSARTSGLNLSYDEVDPHALGVLKPPVAAGRGSGGLQFSIIPGKPNKSILLYRMESNDPGVRMPEINRQVPHAEGIALISEWIRNMKD